MMDNRLIDLIQELLRERKACQRKILASSSLHPGQPMMLEYVKNHPGCSQKQMADEAHVTPPSIAASFKRMERAGMILRREDTADTRCNRVYISKLGEKELDFCQESLENLDEAITDGISAADVEEFEKLLEKMIRNAKACNVK